MKPRSAGRNVSIYDAMASTTRRELLQLLSERTAMDAQAIAVELGLQVSTIRSHLTVLTQAGLISSQAQPRATAGRPRIVYRPTRRPIEDTATDEGVTAGHTTMIELLAANFGDPSDPGSDQAERAGLRWARQLATDTTNTTETVEPGGAETAQRIKSQVLEQFTSLGFEPEWQDADVRQQILMHACPFRSAARAHPEVVCSIHLGLLRGMMAPLGVPPQTTRLDPFVEPDLCIAHLAPT